MPLRGTLRPSSAPPVNAWDSGDEAMFRKGGSVNMMSRPINQPRESAIVLPLLPYQLRGNSVITALYALLTIGNFGLSMSCLLRLDVFLIDKLAHNETELSHRDRAVLGSGRTNRLAIGLVSSRFCGRSQDSQTPKM